MSAPLHTVKGKVLECLRLGITQIQGNNFDQGRYIERVLTDVPHYVANLDICMLATRPEVAGSADVMGEHGIRELPFDPILIECDMGMLGGVWVGKHGFVRLQSKPLVPLEKPSAYAGVLFYAYPSLFIDERLTNTGIYGVMGFDPAQPIAVIFSDESKSWKVLASRQDRLATSMQDKISVHDLMYMAAVQCFLVTQLMLNTKGVAAERVSTEKLDKARGRRGKRPIGGYSLLRIGTIYDKSGKGHDRGSSGRHMPVHYRSGHVRMQHHGAGNKLLKQVFIQPCIVNYVPGTPKPTLPAHEMVT